MRKFIGTVLFLLVVGPAILIGLMAASIAPWALNRQFYTDILSNESIYEIILSDQLPVWLNQEVIPPSDNLPNASLAVALRGVVTPQYLRDQAVTIVNGVFDVIEGRSDSFHAVIDIRPIKTALSDPATRQNFAQAIVDSLPPCTANQDPIAPGGTVYQCLPAGASSSQAAEVVSGQVTSWLETAPDSLDLTDITVVGTDTSSFTAQDWRDFTRVFGGVGASSIMATCLLGLAVPALLVWLLVALISGKGRRGRLQWMGWMLLIPAALVLTIGMAVGGVSMQSLLDSLNITVTSTGFTDPAALRDVISQVLTTVFANMAHYFMLVGGVASGVGLVLIVLGLMSPSSGGDGRYVRVGPPDKPKRQDYGDGGYDDDNPIQPL